MSFVKVNNNQLQLDGKPFGKFATFNTPNLFIQDDPWTRTNEFEQRDLLLSLVQMGAKVARTYTFSFPTDPKDLSKHIKILSGFKTPDCKWELNEEWMADFDRGLKLASDYNIKLIIPIIDYWGYYGGISAFAGMYGQGADSFYTNKLVKPNFLNFIQKVLERRNNITGILIKNDPAILAWETINEGQLNKGPPPSDWTIDIAKFIKNNDPNHLVVDGSYGIYGWSPEVLDSPFVDIFSNHYYPLSLQWSSFYTSDIWGMSICGFIMLSCLILLVILTCSPRFLNLKRSSSTSEIHLVQQEYEMPELNTSSLSYQQPTKQNGQGKWYNRRNCIILTSIILLLSLGGVLFFTLYPMLGRGYNFGLRTRDDCDKVAGRPLLVGELGLAPISSIRSGLEAISDSCAIGAGVWALRGHSRSGGFYTHREDHGYSAYHFPGFGGDESEIISLVEKTAESLSKSSPVVSSSLVSPPEILSQPVLKSGAITVGWRGCAGCQSYSVLVVNNNAKETVQEGISDNVPSGLFNITIRSPLLVSGVGLEIVGFGKFRNLSSTFQIKR